MILKKKLVNEARPSKKYTEREGKGGISKNTREDRGRERSLMISVKEKREKKSKVAKEEQEEFMVLKEKKGKQINVAKGKNIER